MVRDLHDARGVLDDSDLGALFKLADCVSKTVFRNSSVGIDDQNIGSSKDRGSLALQPECFVNMLTCGYYPLPKHDLRFLSAP